MDLGTKNKSLGEPVSSESPKVTYPGFSLRDENVEKVKGDHDCKVGDEYSATVKLKVTGLRDDQYGKSIDFDVVDMDEFSPTAASGESDEGSSNEESDSETKAFGYDRKALEKSKPSVPKPDMKYLTE